VFPWKGVILLNEKLALSREKFFLQPTLSEDFRISVLEYIWKYKIYDRKQNRFWIYIYMYIHIYMYVCIYVYIFFSPNIQHQFACAVIVIILYYASFLLASLLFSLLLLLFIVYRFILIYMYNDTYIYYMYIYIPLSLYNSKPFLSVNSFLLWYRLSCVGNLLSAADTIRALNRKPFWSMIIKVNFS